METYYDILGVDLNASPQRIKEAYRELMKHHHPDLHSNEPEATQQAQIINLAYEILKDPVGRYEYDNLLMLRLNQAGQAEDISIESSDGDILKTEAPHFVCEGCGTRNSSLRVTVFTGVFSFILSWKHPWGRILCSRCRLKFSLLWNIEVWCAGWWGLPFGPWNSIGALAKNSTGGLQPEENNALLLAALADDFYVEHNYAEALHALEESLKLRMTKGGLEFRNHLIAEIRKNARNFKRKKSKALNPLAIHVPLHIAFIALLFWLGLRLLPAAADSAPVAASTDMTAGMVTVTADSLDSETARMAAAYGINTGTIAHSLQVCREARDTIANHLESKVLETSKSAPEGGSGGRYSLDWKTMNDSLIMQQYLIIDAAVADAAGQMQRVPTPLGDSKPSTEHGRQILTSDYYEMLGISFNCSVLGNGIPIIRHCTENLGPLPLHSIENILQIGRRTEFSEWLGQSQYQVAYQNLSELLQNIERNSDRYSTTWQHLMELQATVRDDSTVLATLQQRMEEYKASGMETEYSRLWAAYNDKFPAANEHIQEYNSYLRKYNELAASLNFHKIGIALVNCLNPQILMPPIQNTAAQPRN